MKLSNFTFGRNNNFNLIRIIAAIGVLITHSFALAVGSGDAEPFREQLGMTIGTIAVDVFFVTSGFLVTSSLFSRKSVIEFIWARFLRIFPALLVMVMLSVFGLGLFFTTMPPATYLQDSRAYIYLLKCSTLIMGVANNLPGVFDGNPYKNVVNGSLWTMPYELRMYIILVIVWLALQVIKFNRINAFELVIIIVASAAGVADVVLHFHPELPFANGTNLLFMFFCGATYYVLKERITLSHRFFWLFVVSLCMSNIANKHAFFIIYILTVAYVTFYLAYIPSGLIRKYNQLGDYSYGIYIYAFPIQQSVAALIPDVSVSSMALISITITLILAMTSWHFLERHALGLKGYYVGHTKRIFNLRPKG